MRVDGFVRMDGGHEASVSSLPEKELPRSAVNKPDIISREETNREGMPSASTRKKFHARLRTAWFTRSPNLDSLVHVAHVAKGGGSTPRDSIIPNSINCEAGKNRSAIERLGLKMICKSCKLMHPAIFLSAFNTATHGTCF